MTDEEKAWAEIEAEENPQLALVKQQLAAAAPPPPGPDPLPAADLPADPVVDPDDPIAQARALADAELEANKPPDPAKAMADQLAALQQQMKDQSEAAAKQLRDLNGRYGGLQRELEQVRQEATVAKAAAATSPAAQEAIAQASKSPEKWEAFKKEWEGSGMAEAIEDFVTSQKASASAPDVDKLVEERLAAAKADYEQQIQSMQRQFVELTMNVARPGWKEAVKSDAFNTWRAAQPPEVQALARSPSTDDAIKMLRMFDESTAAPAADKSRQNRARLEEAVHPTRPEHVQRKTLSVNEMTPAQLWAYEARLEAAREGRAQ